MEDKGQGEEGQVRPDEIKGLLEYFSKNTYKARDSHPKVQQVMQKCLELFGLDYNYSVIPNNLGELSTNYPSSLIILESEKGEESSEDSRINGEDLNVSGNGNGLFENHFEVEADQVREKSPLRGTPGGIDLLLESESFIGTTLPTYASNHCSNPTANGNGSISNGNSNSISFTVTGNKTSFVQDNGNLEASKLKDLCSRARFARCRARFPVSVILYNKAHICRSATLSGGPEIYGRSSFDYFFSGGVDNKQFTDPEPGADDEIVVPETQSDWQLFDRVRSQDIRLLKSFQVHTIVDLMVEKKKVKFGVNVTSSEKVDKENRYSEFNLVSLPYPGCEFFKEYRDKGYNAEDLIFEWNQGHVDANIFVPDDSATTSLMTNWTEYRNWDLVTLTQKYLKLLLAYVRGGSKGLLVHCISGWDRTPLFVSLLRLSLWADGAIHKSLSAEQILYLTLAYDWLLFGHNLEDRLSKGEEILFFCFYFLKYIVDSEYSILERNALPKPTPLAPKQDHIRVRNDSDIQLDGVLLEGDGCHTSPEGSNWSLSSVDSSQSNRSQDNPPSYFQIPQDSWEDCNGIQHLVGRNRHNSNQNQNVAQPYNHNSGGTNGSNGTFNVLNSVNGESEVKVKTFEPAIIAENPIVNVGINRTTGALSVNSTSVSVSVSPSSLSSGVGRTNVSSSSSSSRQSPLCLPLSSNSSLSSTQDVESGCFHSVDRTVGKTNPMAVPSASSRMHHNYRPESTSSASIGSWQLITGPGSLREAISSSDPGSTSSHSHMPRLPINGAPIDSIEASESSCTLVEELTPVDAIDSAESLVDSIIAVSEPKTTTLPPETLIYHPLQTTDDITEKTWRKFTEEDLSFVDKMQDSIFASRLMTSSEGGLIDGTPTNVTPTKEQEDIISGRREKLQTVRAHFYTLYASAIGFKFRSVNDNGGSSGLGFLIGNLLGSSKVGNRTVNRTTNL